MTLETRLLKLADEDGVRVLATNIPALGHFHPLVPVALALQAAGHDVLFAGAAGFAATVRAAGFPFRSAGLDWAAGTVDELSQQFPHLPSAPAHPRKILIEVFADVAARAIVPDLLTITREWKPDVILRECYEFGSVITSELTDIPCVTIGQCITHPIELFQTLLGHKLSALRRDFGLGPDPELGMLYRFLYFSLTPPSLEFPRTPLPAVVHHLQPTLGPPTARAAAPDWLSTLPDQPTIHGTFGTIFSQLGRHVYQALIEATAPEAWNLVLTTGNGIAPETFGAARPHVRIERYIPHQLLLPHCASVVTHGGYNTIMASLWFGLPIVVVPLFADQPLNARRCEEAGVARLILRDEVNAETLHTALCDLLQVPSYRLRAQALRDEIHAQPGPADVIGLFERLARERVPLTTNA